MADGSSAGAGAANADNNANAGGAAGGGGAPAGADWTAGLEVDVINNPVIKGRTPAAIAKDLVNAQALIGRTGVRVPKDGDPEAVHLDFRRALGVPDKIDGYEIKPPEGLPAGLWNDDAAKGWGELAHKMGLTPQQEKAIREFQVDRVAAAVQAREGTGKANGAKVESALKEQWGDAMPVRMQFADRAIAHFKLPDGFLDQIRQQGPDSAISTLQALADLGEVLAADSGLIGGRGGVRSTLTPAEAKGELARIEGDLNGPYWNANHPEHALMIEKALNLRKLAAAGQ